MAQERHICSRCGEERAVKYLQPLYTMRNSIYDTVYKPAGLWVCYAATSCKNRRKVRMRVESGA